MSQTSKVVLRIFLILVSLTILLFLTECGQPGGGGGIANPSDIADVGTVGPSALAASGATSTVGSIADIKTALGSINGSTDPLLSDIGSALSAMTTKSVAGQRAPPLLES